jgi:hypothetical protein
MPFQLDSSIPAGIRPFQGSDPFRALDYALRVRQQKRLEHADEIQLRRMEQEDKQAQQAEADRKLVGQAFQESLTPDGLDQTKLFQKLAESGHMSPAVLEQFDKLSASGLNQQKTKLELTQLRQELETHKASIVADLAEQAKKEGDTPTAFRAMALEAQRRGVATEEDLAPYWDTIGRDETQIPILTSRLIAAGRKSKPGESTKTREMKYWNPDTQREEIAIVEDKPGQVFQAPPSKEGTTNEIGLAERAARGDETAKEALRIFREGKAATSNPTEASLALAAAGGDPAAQKAFQLLNQAKPRDERLVQVAGPAGKPIYVRESQAVGKEAPGVTGRPITGTERQSLAFYNRAQNAVEDIAPLEPVIAQQNLLQQERFKHAPDVALSPVQRQYRQAQRSFTEARLRKESGAAIAAHEYENDARTYFAQPGDDQKTIQQKQKAREKVLDGLRISSGRAYEEYYGEPAPTASAGKVETVERGPDGKLKLVK